MGSPLSKEAGKCNGLKEEDVRYKLLSDHLKEGLDIVIVGINPTFASAHVGHHYAGPGNHFWTCLTLAGLVPMPVTCYDDGKMLDYGIGFTNVCTRPTKGASELTRKEMKDGSADMLEKMKRYAPKIAVFNGKGIYEAFLGNKNFSMGRQPKPLEGTDITVFVMPSSSARCAQLPRAEDKLPFFIALRKLRDFIRGNLLELLDTDVQFSDYTEFRVTQPDPKSLRKAERRRKRKAEAAAAVLALSNGETTDTGSTETDHKQSDGTMSSQSQEGGATNELHGGITNGAEVTVKGKSAKRRRPPASHSETVTSQSVSIQAASSITVATEAQLQQLQQQQIQHLQQQHPLLLQQQQQHFQQQFVQHSHAQTTALQHAQQQQMILNGGQLMSASPMVTLSMNPCQAGAAIPVHHGTQAAMAAGCYATPQFQFSTAQGATPQQFFIAPQAAGAAGGQTLFHWPQAAATPSTPAAAVQFQQQQQSTQAAQHAVAATWQAVSTAGTTLFNPQQPQQPIQVGTAIQQSPAGVTPAGGQAFITTSQPTAIQPNPLQMAQTPQFLFSPHNPIGLHSAGAASATAAYPQQFYFAQAPAAMGNSAGASYQLLPVGCNPSNFSSLILSEQQQQQQQQQQQAQLAQCSTAQLQRTQTTLQVQAAQQQQVQFHHQQQQVQQLQTTQTHSTQQQHTYIQAPQTVMTADMAAAYAATSANPGATPQFITLAPGAPLKVMTVGPNGQLIQTTGLPQFMPTAPMGINFGQPQQQHTVAALQHQPSTAVAMTTQRREATPQPQTQQTTQQSNGRAIPTTPAFFTGTPVSSASIPLVQTAAGGEEMVPTLGNPNPLCGGDEKLVYTAL